MCSITISRVHGIIPPGGGNPTQLHVTGILSNCASGNVVVTSTVTGTSAPTPIANLSTGGFSVVLPITSPNVTCGSQVNVTAWCDGNQAQCQTSMTVNSLPCCDFGPVIVAATVPLGALNPTVLNVSGTVFGCYGGQVTVGSAVTSSNMATVDAVTGGYSVQLPVTGTVLCDDRIKIDITCTQNPACSQTLPARVDCGGCARAQVSYTTGTCTGTPPKQPVTLDASISVAKGAIVCFRWFYGDGSSGAIFQIDNSAGTGSTQHPHTEPPHSYAPGTYTAQLVVVDCNSGNPLECPRIPLTVTASCSNCPTITLTADPPQACVNGTQTVTVHANVNNVPSGGCVIQWNFGGTFGPAVLVNTNGVQSTTTTFTAPTSGTTTYTISLSVVSPANCPAPPPITVTIAPCPCCAPTPNITCTVSGCAPTNARAVFDVNSWNWPPGCTMQQVQASSYEWVISDSNGNSLYRLTTTQPHADSSSTSWTSQATGMMGAVQFGNGGNFSVAVIAHTAVTCATSFGTAPFQIPPCCPQLTGLTASVVPGNPCTVVFTAQVTPPNAAATYVWTFQDGTTATTTVPQVTHTFPNSTTTTGASVTLKFAGCTDQTAPVIITLSGCICPSVSLSAPVVTGCIGPGSTAAVSLATTVSPPGAASSFGWTVTTPAGTSFTKTTTAPTTTDGVADGPWTNTSTGATGPLDVTTAGGYAVTVTVSGPAVPPSCTPPAPKSFTIPTCPTTTTGSSGCGVLLVIAIILLLLGALAVIIGVCINVPWVWIVGAIIGAIGLILFILWAIFCSAFTSCSLMRTMHCILFYIIAVIAPILVVIAFIAGGLPCGLATAAAWGGWGTLYAWLGFIMRSVGCPPTC